MTDLLFSLQVARFCVLLLAYRSVKLVELLLKLSYLNFVLLHRFGMICLTVLKFYSELTKLGLQVFYFYFGHLEFLFEVRLRAILGPELRDLENRLLQPEDLVC